MKRITFILLFLFSLQGVYAGDEESSSFDYGFYAVGWSEDGKLAFIVYKNSFDGYGEGTDYHFYIQDLVTDILLESKDFISTDEVLSCEEIMESDRVWYEKIFSKYNIIPGELETPAAFPVKALGSVFDIDSEAPAVPSPGSYFGYTLKHIKLVLVNQTQKREKGLLDTDLDEGYCAWAVKVLKSPFGNRLAVVLFLGRPGWEGLPFETEIEVIGSNLEVGFK